MISAIRFRAARDDSGAIILQVRDSQESGGFSMSDYPRTSHVWRDATVEDLLDAAPFFAKASK